MHVRRHRELPGFKSINGIDLMKLFEEQARALGLEIKFAEVMKVVDGVPQEVITSEETIAAKAVIISTGASRNASVSPGRRSLSGGGSRSAPPATVFSSRAARSR